MDWWDNAVFRRAARSSGIGLMAVLMVVLAPVTTISDSENRLHYSKQDIRRAITFYAKRYRLDPALLRAVIKAESDFRQHVVSKKGAIGLMQLTPDTAATLRVANVYDSVENIRGGARQLRHLLNLYQGDLPLALAAYNAGVHRVKGWPGATNQRDASVCEEGAPLLPSAARSATSTPRTSRQVSPWSEWFGIPNGGARVRPLEFDLHQDRPQPFALCGPDPGEFQSEVLAIHPSDHRMINP